MGVTVVPGRGRPLRHRTDSPSHRTTGEPPFEWSVSQQYPALRVVADGYPFFTGSTYPARAEQDGLAEFMLSVDLLLYAALAALALSVSALLLEA